MAKRKKFLHRIKAITEYGIHIWAILIIANAALVYAFNFSARADNPTENNLFALTEALQDADIEPTEEISEEQPAEEDAKPTKKAAPTRKPKPLGPTVTLNFAVPGIGSGGGTLKPINLSRTLTIFLFDKDANSLNPNVKPLYTIKGTAEFDTDPASPMFTSFGVVEFDLGADVKPDTYQIAFSTDQSLRTLIKASSDNLGGEKFFLKVDKEIELGLQTVNMGDIVPEEGDNVVDISDYNAFVNCYGDRNGTESCLGETYGDFDDNGVVDGIDYNVMLRSFNNLLKQGQSVPRISDAPKAPERVAPVESDEPTEAPKEEPTEAPKEEAQPKSNGGALIGGILFLVFLLLLGIIGFVLYKKNEKVRNTIRSIIHLSPTGKPESKDPTAQPTDGTQPTDQTQVTVETSTSDAATTDTSPVTPDAAQTSDPTTQGEQPVETPISPDQTEVQQPETVQPVPEVPAVDQPTEAPQPGVPAVTEQPAQDAPATPAVTPAEGETIEKDAYLKVKGPDEAGTGQWVLLTDDNGPVQGHYAKNDAKDGFVKVKGVMKTEGDKTFLEISELSSEG